jgi:hypothetical protein
MVVNKSDLEYPLALLPPSLTVKVIEGINDVLSTDVLGLH